MKRKIQEKDSNLQTLQREVISMTSYREEIETRKQNMVSTEVQSEPAMELLEQHKNELESRLKQVKQDIAVVLD